MPRPSLPPLLAPLVLALAAGAAGAQTTHVVTLSGTTFSPRDLTIKIGDTVQWDWVSGLHNVESGVGGVHDGNFRSGNATSSTATTFDVTFDAAFLGAHPMAGNVYPYYCVVHEAFGMVGTVTVTASTCPKFDADADGDVDLRDFWAFQQNFTGP